MTVFQGGIVPVTDSTLEKKKTGYVPPNRTPGSGSGTLIYRIDRSKVDYAMQLYELYCLALLSKQISLHKRDGKSYLISIKLGFEEKKNSFV